jgi:hypothetical protein
MPYKEFSNRAVEKGGTSLRFTAFPQASFTNASYTAFVNNGLSTPYPDTSLAAYVLLDPELALSELTIVRTLAWKKSKKTTSTSVSDVVFAGNVVEMYFGGS